MHIDCMPHLGVVCKLTEGALDSTVYSKLMKILDGTGPSIDPGGTPLVICPHVNTDLLTTATIQLIPYPPNSP